MTGEYQHSLDNKGRLFIPAKLRDELGDVFYVTLSMDRCLCAYSSENWKAFSDKVSAMPYIKQRKMRPLFAHAARCELDSQGRALIPQNLRDFAGLTQRAGNFLVAREEIKDFDWDMIRGTTILGGRPGGMPEMVLEYILKSNGINPTTDVNIIQNIDFGLTSGAFAGGTGDYTVEQGQ